MSACPDAIKFRRFYATDFMLGYMYMQIKNFFFGRDWAGSASEY